MNIGLIISPLLSFTGNVAKAIVVPTLTYGIHTVTRLIMWFMNMCDYIHYC